MPPHLCRGGEVADSVLLFARATQSRPSLRSGRPDERADESQVGLVRDFGSGTGGKASTAATCSATPSVV